jgi:ABC-type transport system involved in cytochrome c biogenesis permease subunit
LQTPLFLSVHVGAAMLAYGIYAIAGATALAELLQRWAGGRLTFLPPTEVSRAVAHRAVVIGLPILTLAILLGALWANLAWRSYWNNDPKELAAAATLLIYLGYLHLAGRHDRWGASAPWLLVLGFGAILFTYLAANLVIPGQHSYSGV